MNPMLNEEMLDVLDVVECDESARCLFLREQRVVLCGHGLKEYFREVDAGGPIARIRSRRSSNEWQYRRLMFFAKPTIAW